MVGLDREKLFSLGHYQLRYMQLLNVSWSGKKNKCTFSKRSTFKMQWNMIIRTRSFKHTTVSLKAYVFVGDQSFRFAFDSVNWRNRKRL